MHVVDASNPHAETQIQAVTSVLKELGCDKKATLLVLNKMDRLEDPSYLHVLQKLHPRSVATSTPGASSRNRCMLPFLPRQARRRPALIPLGSAACRGIWPCCAA